MACRRSRRRIGSREASRAENFRPIAAEPAMIYRCLGRLIGSPLLAADRDLPTEFISEMIIPLYLDFALLHGRCEQ